MSSRSSERVSLATGADSIGARRAGPPESEALSRRTFGRLSVLDDGAEELARRLAQPSSGRQRRALAIFALAGAIALVLVALPVGAGLLLGGFVGFSVQPVYERLRRRYRPGTAAFACAAGTGVTIAGGLGAFGYLLVERGAALVEQLPGLLARGGPLSRFIERAARQFASVRLRPSEIDETLSQHVAELASGVPGAAAQLAAAALNALLTVFFMTITTYFVLRRWDRLVRRAELLLPLHPRHTRALFVQLRDVGRHVLVGTVLTGLAQGLLAALGYWATGVPQAGFFGALTAVASLVPAVGTLLVWAPLGMYLVSTGHPAAGACELAYGAVVVVGFSDYLLRPKLVGDEEAVPALLTFVALFGGVEVFGLIGLVLGPVIVTLAVAVLRTYYEEVAVGRRGLDETVPPRTVRSGFDEAPAPRVARGPDGTPAPRSVRPPAESPAPDATRGPGGARAPDATRGPGGAWAPDATRGPGGSDDASTTLNARAPADVFASRPLAGAVDDTPPPAPVRIGPEGAPAPAASRAGAGEPPLAPVAAHRATPPGAAHDAPPGPAGDATPPAAAAFNTAPQAPERGAPDGRRVPRPPNDD